MSGRAVLAAAAMALVGAGVASPAAAENPAGLGQSTSDYTCDGIGVVTIRVAGTRSETSWGAGKVIGGVGGVLLPTSFVVSAVDVTTGETIFDGHQVKGGGSTGPGEDVWTCHQTMSGPASAFDDGTGLPPGVSPDDMVSFTFQVTAVHRP